MAMDIEVKNLGLTVLGQAQVEFSVAGVGGYTFGDAVMLSSFRRTAAIESEFSSMVAASKLRMAKLTDLGTATATVKKYLADQLSDTPLTDECKITSDEYKNLEAIFDRYEMQKTMEKEDGSTEPIFKDGKITYGGLQTLNTVLRTESDMENNALQRASSTLQNAMAKRDSALQQMSKFQKRIDRTATTITSAIGT